MIKLKPPKNQIEPLKPRTHKGALWNSKNSKEP